MTGKMQQLAMLKPDTRRWAFLFLPLAINFAFYFVIVRPLQAKIGSFRQGRILRALKPVLQSALTQSSQLLTPWRSTGFSTSDPTLVMQTLQQLAATHGVRITVLNSAAETPGTATSMPLELEVSGRFGRLAHWLGDVENRSGFRVEFWSFASAQDARDSQQLNIKLTAILRSAS